MVLPSEEFVNYIQEIVEEEQRTIDSHLNPLTKFLSIMMVVFYLFSEMNIVKVSILFIISSLSVMIFVKEYTVLKPKKRFLLIFSSTIFIIQILFVSEGEVIFYLIPRIHGYGSFFPVYSKALESGLVLVFRFLTVILLSMLFVNTTNPNEFAHALQRVGIPYRIAYVLVLALNFTHLFETELEVVLSAQQSRGLSVTGKNLRGAINITKSTLLPLVSSTLHRAKDISISMDGRAFGAFHERTYILKSHFHVKDLLLVLIMLIFIVFLYSIH